ncbi:hypothetical protein BYT27DRAFT_6868627 [Phlegmacium glaucopus]|nr:hypothetical protein BYT27DRAFT_6868627 [Phlegmacium glaucopus]
MDARYDVNVVDWDGATRIGSHLFAQAPPQYPVPDEKDIFAIPTMGHHVLIFIGVPVEHALHAGSLKKWGGGLLALRARNSGLRGRQDVLMSSSLLSAHYTQTNQLFLHSYDCCE